MEKLSGSEYRALIEKLSELPSFETDGDAMFLSHVDTQARLLWAFYRPSGSHPIQLSDKEPIVAAMGFSHSRLGALQRFRLLNPKVLESDALRQKISKRARMLFRALADEDFREMAITVREFPIYAELSVDQLINGRKMIDEVHLDIESVNEYLNLVSNFWNDAAKTALYARMRPRNGYDEEEVSKLLKAIKELCPPHLVLIEFALDACEEAIRHATHPLKKIVLQKEITNLKKVINE
jgi:hypothetical protein